MKQITLWGVALVTDLRPHRVLQPIPGYVEGASAAAQSGTTQVQILIDYVEPALLASGSTHAKKPSFRTL